MTKQERNKLCGVCKNRDFDPKSGVICGLTKAPATFDITCEDFAEDQKEVRNEKLKTTIRQDATNKTVNKGRYALFVVGGLYILVGFLEAFVIPYHEILFGIIDWGIAAAFIGLAIWSYRNASTALICGLALYVLLMICFAILDPTTLIRGIIWKVLIIGYLIYAISTALSEEKKAAFNKKSPDLLDS